MKMKHYEFKVFGSRFKRMYTDLCEVVVAAIIGRSPSIVVYMRMPDDMLLEAGLVDMPNYRCLVCCYLSIKEQVSVL